MKSDISLLGMHLDMASQLRRRVLVLSVYAFLAALIVAWFSGITVWTASVLAAFFLTKVLGGRRYDDGLVTPFERGDERERARRDHAHYLAWQQMGGVILLALIAAWFNGRNPITPVVGPTMRTFLHDLPYGLLVAAAILYFTLPQAILLWTEPDLIREPESAGAAQ